MRIELPSGRTTGFSFQIQRIVQGINKKLWKKNQQHLIISRCHYNLEDYVSWKSVLKNED